MTTRTINELLDEPLWPADWALHSRDQAATVDALELDWKAAIVDLQCAAGLLGHATADLRRVARVPVDAPAGWATEHALNIADGKAAKGDKVAGRRAAAYRQAATAFEGARAEAADICRRVGVPDLFNRPASPRNELVSGAGQDARPPTLRSEPA
jgi:hypothetical protein